MIPCNRQKIRFDNDPPIGDAWALPVLCVVLALIAVVLLATGGQ